MRGSHSIPESAAEKAAALPRALAPRERIARHGTALAAADGEPTTRSRVAAAVSRLNAASAPALHGQVRDPRATSHPFWQIVNKQTRLQTMPRPLPASQLLFDPVRSLASDVLMKTVLPIARPSEAAIAAFIAADTSGVMLGYLILIAIQFCVSW